LTDAAAVHALALPFVVLARRERASSDPIGPEAAIKPPA